jgi:Copper type II ascorbate-dependent monooxygenase, C-terminal domain
MLIFKKKKFFLIKNAAGIATFFLLFLSCHKNSSPTYSKDIAPIIYNHCSSCHRPGEDAPFPLLTYKDVAKRSLTIQAVTDKKIMPPWPADPTYSHFVNENYLTDAEIKLIDEWAQAGSPIGDSMQIPKPPVFANGSMLGKPDLTLHIKPFLVKGDDSDRFMVMKIPYELSKDTFLRAVEFVAGCKYVHHVNGHIICYEEGKKKNPAAGEWVLNTKDETKESVFQKMQILNDDGTNPIFLQSVTNYLPGVTASVYPEGIGGFSIKKTGIIYLNDFHYGPSPEDVWDSSHVNLFFDKKPPRRPTKEIQLGTLGISDIIPPLIIPPDTVMTFVTRAKILQDISLLTVNPHMHLLGKSFVAYAIKPTGDTIPLIHIPAWNFEWQYFYTFPKMVHIPANSVIEVRATYDNTKNNPNNPFNPPQTVEGRNGSMKATNEMLQLILTFLPYEKGDENISLKTSIGQTK